MENLIPPTKLNPFGKFCVTIGHLPASYTLSLSYEEQLLWFCNFLEKTVIPAINQNAEAVSEVQALFIQLENYVNHYFDNLDVQDEINNKLDEMAESGELENILLNYTTTAKIYNTTVEMLTDKNSLVNNQKIHTFGYYNINDNGGSYFLITNTPNNNLIQINLNNGLYATIIDFNNIEQLGTNENDNITSVLSNIINKISYLNINRNYKINDTLTLNENSNLTINGNNHSIYTETNSTIFINDGNLKLINLNFTGNNTYFPSHIIFNRNYCNVNSCKFENFHTLLNQSQISVIYSISNAEIYNCTFKNLICLGNNVVADPQGVLRAIHTSSEEDYSIQLVVENCYFENINNVNSNNELIVDDADAIVAQGQIEFIKVNINNCYFKQAGKRTIKLQGNNINVSNIFIDNNNYSITTHSIMQIEGQNINVENINGNINQSSYGFFIPNSTNINISNFSIEGYLVQRDISTNACITISNSSNINIDNGTFNGLCQALTIYGAVSKNINLTNINFLNCQSHFINISSRTQSDTSPENCVIQDINIENCNFHCLGNATNRTLLIANTNTEVYIVDNIKFLNCLFNLDSVSYRTGTIYFNNVPVILQNCKFNLNNNLELATPYLFLINNNITALNCIFNFIETLVDNYSEIRLTNSAYAFIENSSINGRVRLNDSAKIISNYNTVNNFYGTTQNNSIINVRI